MLTLNVMQLFLTSGSPRNKTLILCSVDLLPDLVQLITIPAFEGQNAHAELFRNRHHGSDF